MSKKHSCLKTEQKILEFLRENRLLEADENLLLTVSGGRDSTVMFHIFTNCGINFSAAHCNFCLRGSESDEDEVFVKNLCERFKIPFHTKKFDTLAFAASEKINVQLAARRLRYEWFESLPFDKIATAHHAGDNAETVLLNLLRGTGIEGLSGIPTRRGKIIRPLLCLSSAEIAEYAFEKGIVWREDSSNQKTDYRRNFLRKKIFPLLEEIQPETEKIFSENSRKISAELSMLRFFTAEYLYECISTKGDITHFAFTSIEYLPFSEYVFYRFLKPAGFSFSESEKIWAKRGTAGKKWLSKTHELHARKSEFLLFRRKKSEEVFAEISTESGQMPLPDGKILKWAIKDKTDDFSPEKQQGRLCLDADLLHFPLILRKPLAGERFKPFGMGGKSKLISDFLKDQKLSVPQKNNTFVLISNGDVVAVDCIRIAETVRISTQTRRVFEVFCVAF
jgi:tRNA(Ile)-lysidine synthase